MTEWERNNNSMASEGEGRKRCHWSIITGVDGRGVDVGGDSGGRFTPKFAVEDSADCIPQNVQNIIC